MQIIEYIFNIISMIFTFLAMIFILIISKRYNQALDSIFMHLMSIHEQIFSLQIEKQSFKKKIEEENNGE